VAWRIWIPSSCSCHARRRIGIMRVAAPLVARALSPWRSLSSSAV
jgi:hypothetical protein